MASKVTSPLKSLYRNSPRKPPLHEIGSGEDASAGSASISAPSRHPLCPIPLPSQISEGSDNSELSSKGKTEISTPRARSKLQPRTENGLGTPEKSGIARNRFGWNQSRHQVDRDTLVAGDEAKDSRTPSKLSRTSSTSEIYTCVPNVDAVEGQSNNANFGPPNVSRIGSSNHSTPRSTRSMRAATHDADGQGISLCIGTPTRNVSRALRYTGNSTGNARPGQLGYRCGGALAQSGRCHVSDYQPVDVPHFDLEEDPSFWKDHNVQVIIRCRPLNNAEIISQGHSRCVRQETSHTLTWIGQPECRFTFDHVACEKITQEKIFQIAGVPMVDNCMSGYNSCMFAYGQTGSGKTHTMLGDICDLEQRPSDDRGITPRIFEYLFQQITLMEDMRKSEHLKFTCKCSFLEIYNEQITDLLEPSSTNLQMREDVKTGVYVESLSEVEVKNVQDVIFLLLQGAANRKVAATNMNKESSRSHSVFTCIIESQWEADSMTNIRFGRLNLVDLAGSERQKTSGAEGERLKEAANINKSLSTLGLVIMILVDVAQGKQRHVPYRDSKLTFLLQDSLGGNSKTTIIANISPSISCAAETLSTLKFAQRAKFIRNNAIVNEDASGNVIALRLQIQQLKEELHRLSRQSISRIPLSCGEYGIGACGDDTARNDYGVLYPAAVKKVKALEAIVAGSLRREQVAENAAKRLQQEIEQLNLLVKQREDDAQFHKMMLRLREDKIKRLEATYKGESSSDSCEFDENHDLKEELKLLRVRVDKNPELTRFAMENMRLMEQLQRLQDFYNGSERELLIEEMAIIRDQLMDTLEGRADMIDEDNGGKPAASCMNDEDGIVSELKALLREKDEAMIMEKARTDDLNQKLAAAMNNIGVLEEELKRSMVQLEATIQLSERLRLAQDKTVSGEEVNAMNSERVVTHISETSCGIISKSKLQEKLQKTKAALKKARELNNKLENERNSLKEAEHEKDRVRSDAEMETIEAITLLQSEVVELLEDQKISQQREIETEQKITTLEKEIDALKSELNILSSENAELQTLYADAVKVKDSEILKITHDWEASTVNLMECLAEGNQALNAAALEADSITNDYRNHGGHAMNDDASDQSKDANLVDLLKEKLLHAQKLVKETEAKVRILSDVMLSTSFVQRQEKASMQDEVEELKATVEQKTLCIEDLQNHFETMEKKAGEFGNMLIAAFLIIDRFSHVNGEMALARREVEDSLQETTKLILEKEDELYCLQLENQRKCMLLEEKSNAVLSSEAVIHGLREQVEHMESVREECLANIDTLVLEQENLATKLINSEEQVKSFKMQMERVEEINCQLYVEIYQAVDERTVTIVENQLLKDIYTFVENVLEEEIQKSYRSYSSLETQYQSITRRLDENANEFADEKAMFLEALESEKLRAMSLLKNLQETVKEKNVLFMEHHRVQKASQEERMHLQHLIEEIRSENTVLKGDKMTLQDLNARLRVDLQSAHSTSSDCLNSFMENWSVEKTMLIFETEMSKSIYQCLECMLEQNECHYRSIVQLEQESCSREVSRYKERETTLESKIAELCEVVEGLKQEMEISHADVDLVRKRLKQEEQKSENLSKCLEDLSVRLSDCNFSATLEMDVVKHVLMEQVQDMYECCQQLQAKNIQSKEESKELAIEKRDLIHNLETLEAEVFCLRGYKLSQEKLSESHAAELSYLEKELKLEAERYANSTNGMQEELHAHKILLVFESVFSKEVILSMENEMRMLESTLHDCSSQNICLEIDYYLLAKQKDLLIQYIIAELDKLNKLVNERYVNPKLARCQIDVQPDNELVQFKALKGQVQSIIRSVYHLLMEACKDGELKSELWKEVDVTEEEIKQIELSFIAMNSNMLERNDLIRSLHDVLSDAVSAIKQLKRQRTELLMEVTTADVQISFLQAQCSQASDTLSSLGNMYSSCRHELEQTRERSKESMFQTDVIIEQLKSEVSELCRSQEELNMKYEDTFSKLQLRDKEVISLFQKLEDSHNALLVVEQEKRVLEERLEEATCLSPQRMQTEDSDSGRVQVETHDAVGGSVTTDDDLRSEVECQRQDIKKLTCELQRSCEILAEVKESHSKTLDILEQKERDLKRMKEMQKQLKNENSYLRNQNEVFVQDLSNIAIERSLIENNLHLSIEIQETITQLMDEIEVHRCRYVDLLGKMEHVLKSVTATGVEAIKNLDEILSRWHLVLHDFETFFKDDNRVMEDLMQQQKMLLNDKENMSASILSLQRENNLLLGEKNRHTAVMKALKIAKEGSEHVLGAIKTAQEGSERLLEVVEGHDMKLAGLQRKIEGMLSQEENEDVKHAFTEGCELVLSEVEREVQSCRDQAHLAWKKLGMLKAEKDFIEKDIHHKDNLIKDLTMELACLKQDLAMMFENQEKINIMRQFKNDVTDKQVELTTLQKEVANMMSTIVEQKSSISLLEDQNLQLNIQIEESCARNKLNEEELEEKNMNIEELEMELLELNTMIEERKAFTAEHANGTIQVALRERDIAIKERNSLHAEVLVLNEQLEMAQQMAEEQQTLAVEARRVAENSKTLAEEREAEAKFLERSVEELESTVNALETQVSLLKDDVSRQRLMREDVEMEVQELKQQMLDFQHGNESQLDVWKQNERDLEVKEVELIEADKKIQTLEKQCLEKDEQIEMLKNEIMELMSNAERQVSEHQQILKNLENMSEQRAHLVSVNPKSTDRNLSKARGGSPFKCIGSGLSQQINHDIEEELLSNQQKIEELEALASLRQKEIFMLNVRLAEAESMTHDVIRDLVGVKLDITNYAALINNYQVQKFAEKSFAQSEETKEKEKELTEIKLRLNEFIEERESWLEEINRRQAEMMTARVAAEKLRQRDQIVSAENEALRIETASQKRNLVELEEEVKKLSGQQNLQQRIHHHAKIKEENNNLRLLNEDLGNKLRRSEVLYGRVCEELARYRAADGKAPELDLEEEQRLRTKLQEVEEEKIQVAQELLTLCTSVLKVAGIGKPTGTVDHVAAAEALKQLQHRLDSTERELADIKLKNKIEWEKRRLSELRSLHSPIPSQSSSQKTRRTDTPLVSSIDILM